MSTVQIKTLGPVDYSVLENVAPDVFDLPIKPARAKEFLSDPRHHIVVALQSGVVVGFASGVHYVHPDKDPELFINEVGVSPQHQRQGIGRSVVTELLKTAESIGCAESWVLTHTDNVRAQFFYESVGGVKESPGSVLYSFPTSGKSGC